MLQGTALDFQPEGSTLAVLDSGYSLPSAESKKSKCLMKLPRARLRKVMLLPLDSLLRKSGPRPTVMESRAFRHLGDRASEAAFRAFGGLL